jgi:hypothetical protein
MDSGTILFLILVIAGPLAMMWMHRGGHGGHGGHGGSGGGCGGGHSHSRRKAEPARQEAEVRRGHAGH